MQKEKTKSLTFSALFVALIAIGAWIRIPVPIVPFTLQFLFTMLAGLLLGGRLGMITVCIYIILGLLGLPIFVEGGGFSYILKPSFGYIIGFAIAAYVTGKIANQVSSPSYPRLLIANFIGLGMVYLLGMIYYAMISKLYLHAPIGLWTLFLYGFLFAVPGDIVLCIFGAILGKRLIPLIKKNRW